MTFDCGPWGKRGSAIRRGKRMNGVWQKAVDRMRGTLGQVSYETWIGPLNFVGLENRTATVEAPNKFFRDWVYERYLDLMRQSLSVEVGEPVEVKLTFGHEAAPSVNGTANGVGNGYSVGNGHGAGVAGKRPSTAAAEAPRRELHPGLAQRYTFGEFVV